MAAIKCDGAVVTWGNHQNGGDSSIWTEQLQSDVQSVAGGNAMAAVKCDGAVVTWGDCQYGGDSSAWAEQFQSKGRPKEWSVKPKWRVKVSVDQRRAEQQADHDYAAWKTQRVKKPQVLNQGPKQATTLKEEMEAKLEIKKSIDKASGKTWQVKKDSAGAESAAGARGQRVTERNAMLDADKVERATSLRKAPQKSLRNLIAVNAEKASSMADA